jgi:hypothetical protein
MKGCLVINLGGNVNSLISVEFSNNVPAVNCGFFGLATALKGGGGSFAYSGSATDLAAPPAGVVQTAFSTSTGALFNNITVGTHDLRISAGSSLVNAGVTDADIATDAYGNARTAPYDIGPMELPAVPILSLPTANVTGPTTATVGVTTDTAPTVGTPLNVLVLPAASAVPSAATINAGPTQSITTGAAGVRTFPLTGLTTGAAARAHYAHGVTVLSTGNFTPVAAQNSPTHTNVTLTTATVGFNTSPLSTGNAFFLRRTSKSPASAATVISTGESQAVTGTNPQTRIMTGFTTGASFAVDMTVTGSSIVVSTDFFFPGTGRTVGDVDQAGYTLSSGSSLSDLLNEDVIDDVSAITSPILPGVYSGGPILILSSPYNAGTYNNVRIRKWVVGSAPAFFRVNFLNNSNTLMGQTLTQQVTVTPTTYTLSVTLTGTATRIQIEERI